MAAPENISLRFGREVEANIRPRIMYAFRVFAAIYGYRVTGENGNGGNADHLVQYGNWLSSETITEYLVIPQLYSPLEAGAAAERPVRLRVGNDEIPLFYGLDPVTGKPDWLGELFAWLSASHERNIIERDKEGRIPFSKSIFSTERLSPRKPYASLLMAWMQQSLQNGSSTAPLPKAPSPIPGVAHAVICSQDIDFYGTGRKATLIRLVKNLGIAMVVSRSWPFFSGNAGLLLKLLTGKDVGNYLPELARITAQRNIHSTMFVMSRRAHRRDANYELTQIGSHLTEARRWGHSVELHGSYTSIIENGGLRSESVAMQTATHFKPKGNRQHWLRFDRHEKLYGALAEANMRFDTTLGFSETVGFRNGASFAFPPYDFDAERPCDFLEIPLVLMDVSLEAASKTSRCAPQILAEEVLRESRRLGWGGISILWHNPIEPFHVPKHINEVFWNCAPPPNGNEEKWLSADEFISQTLFRYHDAGLMEGVRGDA